VIIGGYGDPWWFWIPLALFFAGGAALRKWRGTPRVDTEPRPAHAAPRVHVDRAVTSAALAVVTLIAGIAILAGGQTGAGIGVLAFSAVFAVVAVSEWRRRPANSSK
jgi:hypothetical protein